MEKKLLKYEEFLNESALSGLVNFLTRKKSKIDTLIQNIVILEKSFIDKEDELSYAIQMANYTKSSSRTSRSRNSVEAHPLLSQQALNNKRALDAARLAKNSKAAYYQSKISRLINKDVRLTEYYNKKAADANTKIAEYASERAQMRGSGYADTYHSQFLELENIRKKIENSIIPDGIEAYEPISGVPIPKPFNLEWDEFRSFVPRLEMAELIKSESDGKALKLRAEKEYKTYLRNQASLKSRLRGEGDDAGLDDAEVEEEEKRALHSDFMTDLEKKLELLKRTKQKK